MALSFDQLVVHEEFKTLQRKISEILNEPHLFSKYFWIYIFKSIFKHGKHLKYSPLLFIIIYMKEYMNFLPW
jgi:hypothetical protein